MSKYRIMDSDLDVIFSFSSDGGYRGSKSCKSCGYGKFYVNYKILSTDEKILFILNRCTHCSSYHIDDFREIENGRFENKKIIYPNNNEYFDVLSKFFLPKCNELLETVDLTEFNEEQINFLRLNGLGSKGFEVK